LFLFIWLIISLLSARFTLFFTINQDKEKKELAGELRTLTKENAKERTTLTIKELTQLFSLPYMSVYNKILPILRSEGYKII